METQNDNNYTIVGLIQEDISKIIGYKGNTLYKNVIEKSMNNLKGLTNHKSQAFIDRINSDEITYKLYIHIQSVNDNVVATWSDIPELMKVPIDSNEEETYNLNKELNEFIHINIDALTKKINSYNRNTTEKSIYRSKFNYRLVLPHSKIGEIIGEGGKNIKAFKSIIEENNFKKVYIKVLAYDTEQYDMYRAIGCDDSYSDNEYILIKIETDDAKKSDILTIENLLIEFINDVVS